MGLIDRFKEQKRVEAYEREVNDMRTHGGRRTRSISAELRMSPVEKRQERESKQRERELKSQERSQKAAQKRQAQLDRLPTPKRGGRR